MKRKKNARRSTETAQDDLARRTREHEAIGAVAGAAAGGIAGALAGPPGMVAGAVVGGAVGALGALALQRTDEEEEATRRRLDAELGISGGDIGAPNLVHPPARIGAYSAAAMGVSSSGEAEAAEGPIQAPEDG